MNRINFVISLAIFISIIDSLLAQINVNVSISFIFISIDLFEILGIFLTDFYFL